MTLSILIKRAFSRLFAIKPHGDDDDKFQTNHYNYCYSSDRSTAALPKLEWIGMLDRTVCLRDGSGLGKIEALNIENIVVNNGAIKPIRYYFGHPMLRKEHYTGHYVVDLASNELTLYQRDMVPNPSYYVTLGGWHFGYMPKQHNNSKMDEEEGRKDRKQQ
ncbi:MAG TPA: hypothetical protein VF172_03170 [Nitrososphaera sp.]|jgi:hypothetical protein